MEFCKLSVEQVDLGQAGLGLDTRLFPQEAPLMAAWTTLFGPLNCNWLLQRHIPVSPKPLPCPAVPERCEIELLQMVARPFDGAGRFDRPLHELRCYQLAPQAAGRFVDHLADFLPHREGFSQCLGAWVSAGGLLDRVWHMWAYRSLEEREAVRQKIIADPVCNNYSAAVTPLIRSQQNWLLKPVALA
jgi:NIPSNAP